MARPDRRAFLALLLWLTPVAHGAAVVPGATWAQRSPAESGWSADGLRGADAIAESLGSDALLVVHHGAIVHAWGAVSKPMNLYSARKSVLSMLYGIHAGRGEIELDASLAQLGIDDRQGLSDTEKTASVRQLLQARSGVYHPAAYETASMAAERPERGSHAPGSFWTYNNWDFNTLGTIFRKRTRQTVFEALDADLARPLQFQDFQLAEHTKFHFEAASEHPAYLMFLSARDLARLGLLMARDGRWGGQQIIPAAWVAESTRPVSTVGPGLYGYAALWWVPLRAWSFWSRQPGDVFIAWGNRGQVMAVDRARDLVIVHRIDGSRWFARNPDLGDLAPLLQALLGAMPV
jgi:CubicO group peptidase (beta-lactamase class C family)